MPKENLTPDPNSNNAMIMGTTVQFTNTDGQTKQKNFTSYENAVAFCKRNRLKT